MTMHQQQHRRRSGTEQLTLQSAHVPVPSYRRLDSRTRRVGLAGVAEAKQILAAQAARRAEREAQLDGRSTRKAA
jgi:hypothetical protein